MTGHRREGSGATGALGLHTDLYELRMVESYLRLGMTAPATFSLFVRPSIQRPWYVALGVHRVLELLEAFAYTDAEITYLRDLGITGQALDYLRDLEVTGEVWAVEDGTVILAPEPIVEVTAPLPIAQLLETAVLNLVQYPTMIATKAARLSLAAAGRPVADFGFRRAQGLETGVEAALAAFVGGGCTTSNVEAGRRYPQLSVVGTMAHSFVQSFDDEIESFRAFAEHHPGGTTLLVDTYDTVEGVKNAIEVGREMAGRGEQLQAIRLDSGDLAALATEARRLLDEAGFTDVQIFASGGLDDEPIHELLEAGAPIDAFGVGGALTVSKDLPALDIVYKLTEYDGRPRAKYSDEKATLPGPKQVFRTGGPDTDVLAARDEDLPGRRLLSPVWSHGDALRSFDVTAARERAREELDMLPEAWRRPPWPDTPPEPSISASLREANETLRRERLG